MSSKATRTTNPAAEPVTRAEAKIHLGIAASVTYHDNLIDSMIKAARENYEHDTDTCIVSSSWTQTYEQWPCEITLLRRLVSAVTHVKYYDTSDTLQTLASTNYWLNTGIVQPKIEWSELSILPTTDVQPEAIIVTYVAGYADAASVPDDIKSNIKLRIQSEWQLKSQVNDAIARPLERAIENMTRRRERSTYP